MSIGRLVTLLVNCIYLKKRAWQSYEIKAQQSSNKHLLEIR